MLKQDLAFCYTKLFVSLMEDVKKERYEKRGKR